MQLSENQPICLVISRIDEFSEDQKGKEFTDGFNELRPSEISVFTLKGPDMVIKYRTFPGREGVILVCGEELGKREAWSLLASNNFDIRTQAIYEDIRAMLNAIDLGRDAPVKIYLHLGGRSIKVLAKRQNELNKKFKDVQPLMRFNMYTSERTKSNAKVMSRRNLINSLKDAPPLTPGEAIENTEWDETEADILTEIDEREKVIWQKLQAEPIRTPSILSLPDQLKHYINYILFGEQITEPSDDLIKGPVNTGYTFELNGLQVAFGSWSIHDKTSYLISQEFPDPLSDWIKVYLKGCVFVANPDEAQLCFIWMSPQVLKNASLSGEIPVRLIELDWKKPMPAFISITIPDYFQRMSYESYPGDGFRRELSAEIDPRFRFFDSSIWHRHISLEDWSDKFHSVMKDFQMAFKAGLYSLQNTYEHLDFHTRLYNQSWIRSSPNTNAAGGHGGNVAPWAFHSEAKMKSRTLRLAEKLRNSKVRWRILLLDDFSMKPLSPLAFKAVPDRAALKTKSKSELLKELLDNLDFNVGLTDNAIVLKENENKKDVQISILCLSDLEDGIKLLTGKMEEFNGVSFDIILLDYLFIKDNTRRFGDELLVELFPVDKSSEKRKGPLGKFWFYPVSVYSNTLTDKLQEAGLSYYRKDSVFDDGADLISTPWLFLHGLLNMMETQLGEVVAVKEKAFRSPLEDLFDDPSFDSEKGRNWAISRFPSIVEQGSKFKRLCQFQFVNKQNIESSVFASSVIDTYYNSLRFHDWEHLQNLVYLIAHGSIHQKAQMWEECQYLRRVFSNRGGKKQDWIKYIEKFELYILKQL